MQPLKGPSGIVGLVVLSMEVTERRLNKRSHTGRRSPLAGAHRACAGHHHGGGGGRPGAVRQRRLEELLWAIPPRRGSRTICSSTCTRTISEMLRSKYQQLVAGEIKAYSREFRVRHKDGSYRWLESSYTSALDNPLIAGVVINSRDITERKVAECRLAQREEVFRLAADAVNGVISEWDVASGFVHRSRGVLEVLGLEPEDLEPTVACLVRAHSSPRLRGGQEGGQPGAAQRPRLDYDLSHSGRARALSFPARARADPAQCQRRSGARHRLLRGCVGDQPGHGSSGGNPAHRQNGRLGIQLRDPRADVDRRDVSHLRGQPEGIRGVLAFHAGAVHAGIAAAISRGLQAIRGGGRPDRPRARDHDLEGAAHLGADDRAPRAAGRASVPRLRFGAERAGAKARRKSPWRTAPGG